MVAVTARWHAMREKQFAMNHFTDNAKEAKPHERSCAKHHACQGGLYLNAALAKRWGQAQQSMSTTQGTTGTAAHNSMVVTVAASILTVRFLCPNDGVKRTFCRMTARIHTV